MQLIQVNDNSTAQLFLQVAVQLYKTDKNWIRPLDKDINDVFDPKKNKAFRFGESQRWILKNNNGQLIGRIASFVNKKYKNQYHYKTCNHSTSRKRQQSSIAQIKRN